MAKSTTAPSERTRPSSRLQPQSLLDSTPILFRLPTIHQSTLSVEEQDSSFGSIPIESTSEYSQAAGSEAAEGAQSSDVASRPPRGVQEPPGTRPELETGYPAAEAAAKSTKASWWEHWSSGVVVILLIVATLVLLIHLTRSFGGAGQDAAAALSLDEDFGDLDLISVPTLSEMTSDLGPSGAGDYAAFEASTDLQSDSGAEDSLSTEINELAAELADVQIPEPSSEMPEQSSEMPEQSSEMPEQSSEIAEQSSEISEGGSKIAGSTGQEAQPEPTLADLPGSDLELADIATATVDGRALLEQSDSLGWTSANQANVAAKPAAGDETKDEIATAELLQPRDQNQPEQPEPSFESSQMATSMPKATSMPNLGSQPPSFPSSATPVSTQGAGVRQLTGGSDMETPIASSAPTAAPSLAPQGTPNEASRVAGNVTPKEAPALNTTSSSAAPAPMATATPQSNEEEIIRAYLELVRVNRASGDDGGEAKNRYKNLR